MGRKLELLSTAVIVSAASLSSAITPVAKLCLNQVVGDFFAKFLSQTTQPGRSGPFYCQLVDVEAECDDLISYDCEVPKVDSEKWPKPYAEGHLNIAVKRLIF